jgi:hypothetical protein
MKTSHFVLSQEREGYSEGQKELKSSTLAFNLRGRNSPFGEKIKNCMKISPAQNCANST